MLINKEKNKRNRKFLYVLREIEKIKPLILFWFGSKMNVVHESFNKKSSLKL